MQTIDLIEGLNQVSIIRNKILKNFKETQSHQNNYDLV